MSTLLRLLFSNSTRRRQFISLALLYAASNAHPGETLAEGVLASKFWNDFAVAVDRSYWKAVERSSLEDACRQGAAAAQTGESAQANCILAALRVLDAPTRFSDGEQYQRSEFIKRLPRGSIGIDIQVSKKSNAPGRVLKVHKGTPAQLAGMIDGVDLLTIDGKATSGQSPDEVLALLRGEPGSSVALRWRRDDGDVVERVATRRELIPTRIEDVELGGGMHYIKVPPFFPPVADQFLKALSDIDGSTDSSGVLLDLRGNNGGDPEEIRKALSTLCSPGSSLWKTAGRVHQQSVNCDRTGGAVLNNRRIVVLVDETTASGAEIFVRALRAQRPIVTVGRPTFGSNSIQTWYHLDSSAAVYFPTERLLDAGGVPVSGPLWPGRRVPELTGSSLGTPGDAVLQEAIRMGHEER